MRNRTRTTDPLRLAAVSASMAVLFAASCRRPRRSQPAAVQISRATALRLLRRAALRAGGNSVWVKGSVAGKFPPPRPTDATEVLTEPRAFSSVFSAVEREAANLGLKVKSLVGQGPTASLRISEVRTWQTVWQIQEVPRLLRVSIVIDDLGANDRVVPKLIAIPYPLTFSILPRLRYSIETANQAFKAGREVMLHLPMEPIARPGIRSSPDEIRVGMSGLAVDRLVQSDLDSIPHVRGVNNHQGSRATSDPHLMAEVMRQLAGRHLYFVDSRTIGSSVAWQEARKAGVPAVFRSVFLDDTESVSYTVGQLRQLERAVRRQGVALAIGHPHPTTLRALRDFLPRFAEQNIEIVPVSYLVRLPETARLYPPRPFHPMAIERRLPARHPTALRH